ncbi:hypothetical protein SPAN111604_05460 [Sphingomonas antarctica]|uniref:hypothetical protein n=1 Tax=Sphingomonas antarctica TaxID=2040274 RepID=UPI0039E7EA3D
MLKHRTKRVAARDARAVKRLAEIEASIVTLSDDDLLDLADIFKGELRTPLSESASAEMAKRKISL